MIVEFNIPSFISSVADASASLLVSGILVLDKILVESQEFGN